MCIVCGVFSVWLVCLVCIVCIVCIVLIVCTDGIVCIDCIDRVGLVVSNDNNYLLVTTPSIVIIDISVLHATIIPLYVSLLMYRDLCSVSHQIHIITVYSSSITIHT